jgi:hypothetical protein
VWVNNGMEDHKRRIGGSGTTKREGCVGSRELSPHRLFSLQASRLRILAGQKSMVNRLSHVCVEVRPDAPKAQSARTG